jgi:hypothetical protein
MAAAAVGTYNNANNTSESTEMVVYEIKQVNRIGIIVHHPCSPLLFLWP